MSRTRSGAAGVVVLLAILLALPSGVGADTRIPVNSTDDATSPTANRIAAVTNIVNATNARFVRVSNRVSNAFPPNPCIDLTPELLPVCLAAAEVIIAYETLGQSVAAACAAIPTDGLGDAVITDTDAFAADTSLSGIAKQLASIGTVLGNANDRLGGIRAPNPGPPDITALTALGEAIAKGQGTVGAWLVPGTEWPPNPCVPEPGPPD